MKTATKNWRKAIKFELDHACNYNGKLHNGLRRRIYAFFDNPNTDTWDAIQSIIICKYGTVNTIWQFIIQIDPSFPKTGRRYYFDTGKMAQDWETIPSRNDVHKALVIATH